LIFQLFSGKGLRVTSTARRICGAAILALSLALTIGAANAQTTTYDDTKLQSFVTAALSVNELIQQWTPRIQGAQNEAEAADLRTQANSELIAAIEKTDGMTVDEYREISLAAQSDPTLMARIEQIFKGRSPQ
jgi:hypothetical protein